MNPEEAAIATELAAALKALNAALEKAHTADMVVAIDYMSIQEIGKKNVKRVYFADVSKPAFSHRIG